MTLQCEQAVGPRDLLDSADRFGRVADNVTRGCGVWSIIRRSQSRCLENGFSDNRSLLVIYDDERYDRDKIGLHWCVLIRHDLTRFEDIVVGWGRTRSVKRQCISRTRYTERMFANRAEACAFAKKIWKVFIKANSGDD